MTIDIQALTRHAFICAPAEGATPALAQARERFSTESGLAGFSFEVVAPDQPDERWVKEELVRPLVYYCESVGAPLPNCSGVFLSLFYGKHLYCIVAAEAIAWAATTLRTDAGTFARNYGTREQDTALR
jgi:hypothetical protein